MVNRLHQCIVPTRRTRETLRLFGLIIFAASPAFGQANHAPGRGAREQIGIVAEALGKDSLRDIRPSNTDTTNRHNPNKVPLLRPRDAVVGIGVATLIFAIMPADRAIARAFQKPSMQSPRGLRRTANVLSGLSDPGTIVFSAATYVSGLVTHSRPVAALGMHTGEAVVLGGVITGVLKGTFGRTRPRVDITTPHEFHIGKGFASDDHMSFPSGDVTLAFAAATAASQEVARSWPDAAKYVTPAAYGAASLVAVSRIYKNEHWASDVVGGAGVGILAGVLVSRFNRAHSNNLFDRIFLPMSIVPGPGGVTIAWVIHP